MGLETKSVDYTKGESEEFKNRLQIETQLLKNQILDKKVNNDNLKCGYEVEGCLVDDKNIPSFSADNFLTSINDDSIVPEISKHNFEINGSAFKFEKETFSNIEKELNFKWKKCESAAELIGKKVIAIGSLPTITESMMCFSKVSPKMRYTALNSEVLKQRNGEKITLNISGIENYQNTFPDVMSESTATSLQIHLGATLDNAHHIYNASIIASSLIAASCANSPFLYGKDLWDETRIPIFEQAVDCHSYTTDMGESIKRVTLGSGYLNKCITEVFIENAYKHPVFFPELLSSDPTNFDHLNFQNGTIWRWNRPIISTGENGNLELRLEQRVPSSGPTNIDMTANMMFVVGLINFLAMKKDDLKQLPFFTAKHNFYHSCKHGLKAQLMWFNGRDIRAQKLILELLPSIKSHLKVMGFCEKEISYYLDEIFEQRVISQVTGSSWQRDYIKKYGRDFHQMVGQYILNQKEGSPIWKWKI